MRINHRVLSTCAVMAACVLAGITPRAATAAADPADWPTFGGNNARTNANMAPTKITAANVGSMVRTQVKVSAPIDAGLIYLKGVRVNGAARDVFFGTTNLGRTVAIDANEGKVLWEYASPGFDEAAAATSVAPPGGRIAVRQISNSTPVADDNRQFIYAAGADGKVVKLAIADGKAVWSTAVTKAPNTEKMDSPLNFVNGKVLVPTAGYVGDQPPYQGHVVVLNAQTGALEKVWNSLCSDRAELLDPKACPQNQSAIWGRAGIVIDPANGNLLFTTGNGPYDGKTSWGDSVLVLDSTATKLVGNWTPANNAELNQRDLDLGSTSPVLLGDGYIAQGGKAGLVHLLNMDSIKGTDAHQGNELQTVEVPGKAQLLSASATAKIDGKTYLFVSSGGRTAGTTAWTFGADRKLTEAWKSTTGGNTPFYAGGLLYIYTVGQAAKLNVLEATTGKVVAAFDVGTGHWNSAIVVDNRIALPEGAISGFGGGGGGRGGGRPGGPGAGPGGAPAAPGAAPAPAAAPPAPPAIPEGIVNIWRLP
jgi:lipoprotein-anchoring transpeptidase ErfK/SrfK